MASRAISPLLLVAFGGLVAFLGTLLFFLFVWHGSLQFTELPGSVRAVLMVGIAGGFLFWASMLVDFLRNRDLGHRLAWALSLIFLWWIGATIYFFRHFLPRHRRVKA